MRKGMLVWMGLGMACAGGLAWGQQAGAVGASTRPGATTRSLLAELGSDDWRVRQGVIDELVKRGAAARGEIEGVLGETNDVSVQADLRAALRQIEENARFGATRVTMHLGEGASAKEAFEELGRQAGVRFVAVPENLWDMRRGAVGGGNGRQVSGDWEGAAFWRVLADLCERTGLSPNPGAMGGGDANALALYMGTNGLFSGPMCVSGPCAVIAGSVQRNQSVTYVRAGLPGGGRQADLRLQLYVWVEPKVRVVRMGGVSVTEAEDELGNSLVKATENGGGWPSGRAVFNVSVGLRDVEGIGKRLAVLKGVARLGVVESAERVEASTSGEGVGGAGTMVNGVKVRVTELKEEGPLCVVKVLCTSADPRQRLQSLWETAQAGGMRMMDGEGRALIPAGVSPSRQGPGTMELTGRFSMQVMGSNGAATKATGPVKMVWEVPTGTRELGVPFEFRDLALP